MSKELVKDNLRQAYEQLDNCAYWDTDLYRSIQIDIEYYEALLDEMEV